VAAAIFKRYSLFSPASFKIPTEQIIDIWCEESKRGRYLNKFVWGLQALEQAAKEIEAQQQ
jgi:hypothetical protein